MTKNIFRTLFAGAAVLASMASCLDGDNSMHGFPNMSTTGVAYANTDVAYVGFISYGDWKMTQVSGDDWCKVRLMSGSGNAIYSIPIDLEPNTTGKYRTAQFNLDDVSGEAYTVFSIGQYATRGDGSMGSAPVVKTITGDDGSSIELVYDELSRPVRVVMTKNDKKLHSLEISFNKTDTLLQVNTGSSILTGDYNQGYQALTLRSESDTVSYYTNGIMQTGRAFNFRHGKKGGEYVVQALKLKDNVKNPDSDLVFDSLRYQHRYSYNNIVKEYMKLTYSDMSNRNQSVDVNQLLLGIEECNPYALVSLVSGFSTSSRLTTRSSKIISEASTESGKFVVSATLNADKSVNTLAVTDKGGNTVTYTFGY